MRYSADQFQIGPRAMRFSLFAPRLYHLCLEMGFARDRLMPSRAFCSDETQGYPVVLLMQHFGAFPFDHGRVGGRLAVDRHGPLSGHGDDFLIVQASHVGFDPASGVWGGYPRLRAASRHSGSNCGKICAVLSWYRAAYARAQRQIQFATVDGRAVVFIDNELLDERRTEGLFLRLQRLIDPDHPAPLKALSTATAFAAAPAWAAAAGSAARSPIGARLTADLFAFRRAIPDGPDGPDLFEAEIAPAMPALVTSPYPELDAARVHTQVEFDRVYRSFGAAFEAKNLLYVAGLNIDVAPAPDMPFPLTKFVPWAAYWRKRDGAEGVMEQDEIVAALERQPIDNPAKVSLDDAIAVMARAEAVALPA